LTPFVVPYSIDIDRRGTLDQRLKIAIVQDNNKLRLYTTNDGLHVPDNIVYIEQHIFFENQGLTLVFYKDVKAGLSIQEKLALNMFLEAMR